MSQKNDLRIVYVPLSDLKLHERNPKNHNIEALNDSVERFGYVSPIIVDDTTGKVVAGHGRIETLQKLKAEGKVAPSRVKVDGDEWLVPVIHGIAFRDQKEAEAYLLADNKLAEIGGWFSDALTEILKDHADNIEGIGFTQAELNQILADFDDNTVKDPIKEWKGLPTFEPSKKSRVYRTLLIHFESQDAVDSFAALLGQNISDKTKYLYYPKQQRENLTVLRYVQDDDEEE